MTARPAPITRLLDFLGDLGPRWGLPEAPCRVHGYLYLHAKAIPESALRQALVLDAAALRDALTWLADYRLVERTPAGWRTESDPWELMLRALDERRRREAGPALDILRECHGAARADRAVEPAVAGQIGKLLALAEDLTAIDTQMSRLSPRALRQVVGLGGRAARFIDRAFGGRDK